MVSETKIDDTFPTAQFTIEGYGTPFWLDGNAVNIEVPPTHDDVRNATNKFKHHPCIIKIKDIVNDKEIFTFNHKTEAEI